MARFPGILHAASLVCCLAAIVLWIPGCLTAHWEIYHYEYKYDNVYFGLYDACDEFTGLCIKTEAFLETLGAAGAAEFVSTCKALMYASIGCISPSLLLLALCFFETFVKWTVFPILFSLSMLGLLVGGMVMASCLVYFSVYTNELVIFTSENFAVSNVFSIDWSTGILSISTILVFITVYLTRWSVVKENLFLLDDVKGWKRKVYGWNDEPDAKERLLPSVN